MASHHKVKGWFYSKSRFNASMKKLKGFEAWFYTGPTAIFESTKKTKK